MTCRIGILCLLAAIGSAGCQRTDGPTAPAQVDDVARPRLPAAGELNKFEGTWVVTAAQLDGEDLPGQVGQEYTFAAGKLTLRQGDRVGVRQESRWENGACLLR